MTISVGSGWKRTEWTPGYTLTISDITPAFVQWFYESFVSGWWYEDGPIDWDAALDHSEGQTVGNAYQPGSVAKRGDVLLMIDPLIPTNAATVLFGDGWSYPAEWSSPVIKKLQREIRLIRRAR